MPHIQHPQAFVIGGQHPGRHKGELHPVGHRQNLGGIDIDLSQQVIQRHRFIIQQAVEVLNHALGPCPDQREIGRTLPDLVLRVHKDLRDLTERRDLNLSFRPAFVIVDIPREVFYIKIRDRYASIFAHVRCSTLRPETLRNRPGC